MLVQDIMAKNPAVCLRDTPLVEAARLMVEFDCGALPVVKDKETFHPVGVITDRDIVCRVVAENQNPLERTVEAAMTTSAVTVGGEQSVDVCSQLMQDHQIRRVAVVDNNGACIGMVSQADLALNRVGDPATTVREISEPDDETDVPLGGDYSG